MPLVRPDPPNWGRLYKVAVGQSGYFTTRQAQEAGYSLPLLTHHTRQGRLQRARRGVYRLSLFPADEHEDLMVLWLWSEQQGVFSHETALTLHQLSDVLPVIYHLTLPASWRRRRLRVPDGVRLYFADISQQERAWSGGVPVTKPLRTLLDCVDAHIMPELIRDAYMQALERGLADPAELRDHFRSRLKGDDLLSDLLA
jgi:predicted transcriptional regulator of viral defense system